MKKAFWIFAVTVLLLPAAGRAQQKGAIEIKSFAEVEVTETSARGDKTVKRVDAAKASVGPGDTVIFTSLYANKGAKPASGVVITNPVPEHMTYGEGSAEGKGCVIDFSTDGGKTFAPAETLTVTLDGGKARPATGKDYTTIRWRVQNPLAPGATGNVSFRARVK